jgi:YD repeat-containing protein
VEGNAQVAYGYDALYRLTSETRTGAGAYTATTGYDLANNITTKNGAILAAYDGANKISTLTGGSVTYDAAGNLLTLTGAGVAASTFTWDAQSELRSQTQGKRTLELNI